MAGRDDDVALPATEPFLKVLEEKLDQKFDIDVAATNSLADLKQLANELDSGTLDLAVLWGVEYGWLQQMPEFQRLEPLVVCEFEIKPYSMLLVRKEDPRRQLRDFRNNPLARYSRSLLIDQLFIASELRKLDTTVDAFFARKDAVGNARDAVLQVARGNAACLLIDIRTLTLIQPDIPNQVAACQPLIRSDTYPEPLLIGAPEVVTRMRSESLWHDIRRELLAVHRSPRARTALQFWTFDRFGEPNDAYDQHALSVAIKYPIGLLAD